VTLNLLHNITCIPLACQVLSADWASRIRPASEKIARYARVGELRIDWLVGGQVSRLCEVTHCGGAERIPPQLRRPMGVAYMQCVQAQQMQQQLGENAHLKARSGRHADERPAS
jgi:hypothetical protein